MFIVRSVFSICPERRRLFEKDAVRGVTKRLREPRGRKRTRPRRVPRSDARRDPSDRSSLEPFPSPHPRLRRDRVGDIQTAEDILQEVFIRAHAGVSELRDETRLTSWMYQIARNAVIDHYRSRRDDSRPLSDAMTKDDDWPLFAQQRLAESVATMIDELPEGYRDLLRLTELEGLTQAEAASRLGLSLTAAKSRVQRGRDRLREMILDCCHVELDRNGRILDYWQRPVCCDRGSK